MELKELLLDKHAWVNGELRLADAPRSAPLKPGAAGFTEAYRGMRCYESALDQAGYETEAEMKEPGAMIHVALCEIHDDGTVVATRPGRNALTATAAELYAAHNMEPPELSASIENESPEP